MEIRPEAKQGFKKFWSILVFLYLFLIHIVALTAFMDYKADIDGILITLDILDYHKTILLMNN